jgi:integrase
VIGDKPLEFITRDECRNYREVLNKLPLNYSRSEKYKDIPINDIIKLNTGKTISITRLNYLIGEVSSLFEWAVNENLIVTNPAKNLSIKDTRKEIDERLPFDIVDLNIIFNHPKYTEAQFKYPAYYWIPLVGLFTGMRLEEISQLYAKDIYLHDNIWIIDINEKGVDENGFEKTLKNKNAIRIIPVHNALVDLGFIEFSQFMAQKNSLRLFPELTKTEKTGKYGKQPGKQFSALIKTALEKNNISFENKSFHSLRHTFDNFYKQNNLIDDAF